VNLAQKPFQDWDNDERREAARVCSTYDVTAIIIRLGLVPGEPFVENWGPSIRHCFEVTRAFIEEMQRPENSGPTYWDDFGWLYEEVQKQYRVPAKPAGRTRRDRWKSEPAAEASV
jgi:hypothetical protein